MHNCTLAPKTKTLLQILFCNTHKRKDVLTFPKFSPKFGKTVSFLSSVTGSSPEFPNSTKTGSKKNVSPECFEIPDWKFASKRSIMMSFHFIQIAKLLSRVCTLLKKWDYSMQIELSNLSFFYAMRIAQSSTYNYPENRLYSICVPATVPRIFKIAGRALVVESLFSKVTGYFYIPQIYRKLYHLLKSTSSKNFAKFPFNWSCKLTGCKATKNELLTRFLKSVLKMSESTQEQLYK